MRTPANLAEAEETAAAEGRSRLESLGKWADSKEETLRAWARAHVEAERFLDESRRHDPGARKGQVAATNARYWSRQEALLWKRLTAGAGEKPRASFLEFWRNRHDDPAYVEERRRRVELSERVQALHEEQERRWQVEYERQKAEAERLGRLGLASWLYVESEDDIEDEFRRRLDALFAEYPDLRA